MKKARIDTRKLQEAVIGVQVRDCDSLDQCGTSKSRRNRTLRKNVGASKQNVF